jgi:hypothetical protein
MTTPREVDPETRIRIRSHERTEEYRLDIIAWLFIFAAGFLVGGLTGRYTGARECAAENKALRADVVRTRAEARAAIATAYATAEGTIRIALGEGAEEYEIPPKTGCDAGDEPAFGRNDRCWDNPPLREAP